MNMYLSSILWFISWPAFIVLSYQVIKFLLKKYEPVLEHVKKKEEHVES
jgi:hypothetical protein